MAARVMLHGMVLHGIGTTGRPALLHVPRAWP